MGSVNCLLTRLRLILIHVFKCINGLNPQLFENMYEEKSVPYSLRQNVMLVQPRRKSSTYGLRSISYLGAKLWNEIARKHDLRGMDLSDFKCFIYTWNGPSDMLHGQNYI